MSDSASFRRKLRRLKERFADKVEGLCIEYQHRLGLSEDEMRELLDRVEHETR